MAFKIPNIEDAPSFDAQAVPDFTDWTALIASTLNTGVLSGCSVAAHGGGSMAVDVAAGSVWVNGGTPVAVTSASNVAIAAASATDRKDIVIFTPGIGVETSGSGTTNSAACKGTACGTVGWTRSSSGLPPIKPSLPSGSVLLAEVYVGSTTTSIAAANLIDKTLLIGNAPIITSTPAFSSNAYTLALTDAESELLANNGSTAGTITVPPNSSVAFPVGTVINITQSTGGTAQTATGKISVAAGAGVTINSPAGALGCRVQHSTITLLKVATNVWQLGGDLG